MTGDLGWHEQRRAAFEAHTAALDRQRAAETARARTLLAGFVQEMTDRGVPPTRLRARVPGCRARYRTGLTGWYLRRDGSLAVGVDGEFYLLETPPRLWARLAGVRVRPTDPPLRVGVGARDGESMPLEQLLRRRVEAGHDFGRLTG
jgi:hypothetical protein